MTDGKIEVKRKVGRPRKIVELKINETIKEKQNEKEKEKIEKNGIGILNINPGEKLFEAPDGTIIPGEKTKDRLWYRQMNDGKGGWINPKR